MPKYIVTVVGTVHEEYLVEAEDEQEALETWDSGQLLPPGPNYQGIEDILTPELTEDYD